MSGLVCQLRAFRKNKSTATYSKRRCQSPGTEMMVMVWGRPCGVEAMCSTWAVAKDEVFAHGPFIRPAGCTPTGESVTSRWIPPHGRHVAKLSAHNLYDHNIRCRTLTLARQRLRRPKKDHSSKKPHGRLRPRSPRVRPRWTSSVIRIISRTSSRRKHGRNLRRRRRLRLPGSAKRRSSIARESERLRLMQRRM